MSWVPLDRWAEVEEWNAEITCSIQKDTFIDDAAPGTTSTSLRSNYQATVVLRGVLASWSGEGTCSGTWLEKTVTQGPGDQVGTADVDGSGSGPASAFLNLGIDLVTGKGEYDLRCSRLTFPVNVVTETTTAGHTDTVASIGERTIYVPEIRNQPLPESGLVLAGEREIETELGTAMLSWNLTPAPPVLTTCYVEITDHAGTPLAGLQTVNVGERVQLKVRVILPLGATIDSVQWTIPGTIIKDYVITPTTAQVQTIIPADLQQESITFYWVDGATGHIVEAKAIVNGLTCTASVTFDVNRPSVLLFRAAIRHVITIGFPPAPPPAATPATTKARTFLRHGMGGRGSGRPWRSRRDSIYSAHQKRAEGDD